MTTGIFQLHIQAARPSGSLVSCFAFFVSSVLIGGIAVATAEPATPRYAGSGATARPALPRVYPGEYVVSMPQRAPMSALRDSMDSNDPRVSIGAAVGVVVRDSLGLDSYLVTRNVASMSVISDAQHARASVPFTYVDTFCRDLLATGAVSACSPNYELHLLDTGTNDPLGPLLWGLSSERGVAAPRAWGISTGSRNVVAAVIDTGVDFSHPDLAANMWINPGEIPGNATDDDGNGYIDDIHGINAISSAAPGASPRDDNSHGTHVAGTIGAVGGNGLGVVGIVPNAQIMALKFLDSSGAGSLADAIRAIDYMVTMKTAHGVPVVVANNSWGGGELSNPLLQAFARARDAGIIMVSAAGNESNDNDAIPSYPASFELDNVVSVAATDDQGNLADFSNFGLSSVDVAAPGVSIISTVPGGGYGMMSGTSMATPHVTGAILLLYSAEPTLSMAQALQRLYEAGRESQSLRDTASGEPLVRSQRMVDVGRMVFGEVVPLPPRGDLPSACGYDLRFKNLRGARDLDTGADAKSIVQQSDEGDFVEITLPFSFPFFRGSTSTVYLSPNGVVYANYPPRSLDYQVGSIAPRNAIAALHTDLVPRRSGQGIRVSRSPERVTIAWTEEYFGAPHSGEVKVRLTLYPSGRVVSSVVFPKADSGLELQRALLGDPFATPEVGPQAVIGATGASARYSSTVDILGVQRALMPNGLAPLSLGVTMIPNCFPYQDDSPPQQPLVEQVTLKKMAVRAKAGRTTTFQLTARGAGTGTVGLRASIDGQGCSQRKNVPFSAGIGSARVVVPSKASLLTVMVDDKRKSVRLSSGKSRSSQLSRREVQRACAALFSKL